MKINKGFTFIEILIVISLIAVITTTAAGLFTYSLRINQKSKAILEVKQVGDQAISLIAGKIRSAQSISDPDCSNNESGIQLTFEDDQGDTVTINLTNEQIKYEDNYLTGSDLTVSGLSFTCYGEKTPMVVDISFNLAKNPLDPLSGITLPFFTSVQLRQY